MPRAVLFDLDDTLFDLRHASRTGLAGLQAAFPELRAAPLDDIERIYRKALEETHVHVLAGVMTVDEARRERYRYILRHYRCSLSAEAERLAFSTYQAAYRAARRAMPGAIQLLSRLRPHANIAVVSNNLLAEQREKLAVCGLTRWVDALIVSEVVGVAKPEPAIFAAALAAVGCRAPDAVMVGDAWESDIVGAQHAGIRAVWLNRFGVPCPDPALATEITSLEPNDALVALLLDEPSPHYGETN